MGGIGESGPRTGGTGFNPQEILQKMRKDYWEGLARPPSEAHGATFLALTFEVEGQVYAVRVDSVREVIKVPPWISKVPRSPKHLLGIMNLRGQIIPVLDIRESARSRVGEKGRIVVFRGEGQDIGLYADRVVGLPEITVSEVQKPRGLAGPLPAEVIEGQVEVLDEESGRKRIANLVGAAAMIRSPAFEFREA